MIVPELMDLPTASHSFPGAITCEVKRDNILDAIDTVFDGETQVVVVEGASDAGKTRLLRQFVLRHPNHAFSLFISPVNVLRRDPDILRRDLCNQIVWALDQRPLSIPTFWRGFANSMGASTWQAWVAEA